MNLHDYMTENGISTSRAAKELGADKPLVSRWRRGIVKPGRVWWLKLQAWSRFQITDDVKRVDKNASHMPQQEVQK